MLDGDTVIRETKVASWLAVTVGPVKADNYFKYLGDIDQSEWKAPLALQTKLRMVTKIVAPHYESGEEADY